MQNKSYIFKFLGIVNFTLCLENNFFGYSEKKLHLNLIPNSHDLLIVKFPLLNVGYSING